MKLKKMICGLVVFMLVFSTGCGAAGEAGDKKKTGNRAENFSYISHRGACDSIPENTVEAFSYAMDRGFDGIEMDVWETDSGDLLVFHDATLERMCNSDKYIWEISEADRNQYPIQFETTEKKKKTDVIPTLAESLDVLKDKNCPVYLHIKIDTDAKHYFSEQAADKVVALLEERNMTNNTIIFSTHQNRVMSLFTGRNLNLGYITGQTDRKVLQERMDWCEENKVGHLILYKIDGIRMEENGADLVKECHDRGFSVGVYKVNTKDDEQFLIETGADFSISGKAFFE